MTNTVKKLEIAPVAYKGTTFSQRIYEQVIAQGLKLITIQLVNDAHNGNIHEPINVKNGANENVLGFAEVLIGTYQDFEKYNAIYMALSSEERQVIADTRFNRQVNELLWGLNKRGHSYNPEDTFALVPIIFVEEFARNRGIGKLLMTGLLSQTESDVYLTNMPYKRTMPTGEIKKDLGYAVMNENHEIKVRLVSFFNHFNAEMHFALPTHNTFIIRK